MGSMRWILTLFSPNTPVTNSLTPAWKPRTAPEMLEPSRASMAPAALDTTSMMKLNSPRNRLATAAAGLSKTLAKNSAKAAIKFQAAATML